VSTQAAAPPAAAPEQARTRSPLWDTVVVTALSFVLALVIGGILIAVSAPAVTDAASYLFARPGDTISAAWEAVSGAYLALFQGAVFDTSADTFQQSIRPLTESLTVAAPLIVAGLAVALPFKAGLFNIGAEGQIILGAIGAAWVGFTLDLPWGVHLLVAVVASLVLGALWGGVVGLLKARTGAHEVIVTIMLNYVARFLLAYLLTTAAFQRPGRNDPISPIVEPTAQYPLLLGGWSRLHLGFLVALLAAAFVWWLLNRSVLGFQFRAVGANPSAARTAGIDVNRSFVLVMAIAGALAGLAGSFQVLGTEKALSGGVSAGIGFDAITVALLGRGSPLGTVLAGILFGALRAGGVTMQARTGTPIDIVLVVQSLIVLFVAAPPLVRAIFRLKGGGTIGTLQVSKGWGA
jgi:simple sugar transport system permease protein